MSLKFYKMFLEKQYRWVKLLNFILSSKNLIATTLYSENYFYMRVKQMKNILI